MKPVHSLRLKTLTLAWLGGGISAVAFAAGGVPARPIPTEPLVSPGETRLIDLPETLRDLRGVRPDDKTNAAYPVPYALPAERAGFPVSASKLAQDDRLKVSDFRTHVPDADLLARLRQKATGGDVNVMVSLKMLMTPEGLLSAAGVSTQQATIAALQTSVLSALSGRHHRLRHRMTYTPQLSLTVDAAVLDLLARLPEVADIEEVAVSAADLADSVPLVGAADVHERGFTGGPWVVAVLDTGIDRSHTFLRGFVAEACFSANGNCPNGGTTQTGPGAAAACTYSGGCDHGSHVAGIATGASQAGFTSLEGVARGSRVMPVQVFSRFTGSQCTDFGKSSPCELSFADDQAAALDFVFGQRFNFQIAAVNVSIGGGRFTGFCDGDIRKPAIDNLRSAGIATVISAGNSGYVDAVGAPGCISSAVVVGATNKDDTVASYSNNVNYLDLFAPGSNITSSVTGNAFGIKSGTSMAAPHVAGAWALMQSQQNRSVADTRSLLLNTGTAITDSRSGAGSRVKPRINVLAAMSLNHVALSDFVPREYRQPRPIPHDYNYVASRSYWSAVAVRPDNALLDVDLQLFDFGTGNGLLGASALGAGAIDVIAQDNNTGRRALGTDFPRASIFGNGTGRYRVELSNPGLVLNNTLDDVMDGTHVLRIYDASAVAGVQQFIRVVPTGINDLELMAFTSTADASTWIRGRSSATAISSVGGTGVAEAISFTPTFGGFAGIVVTNKSGGFGGYTVYRDTTAPVGSVVINNNDATTTNPQVTLTLSASDPQTGILDMRVAADGIPDSETWEPYATSKTVTLPAGPGVKTVAVQYRNRAGQTSPAFTDTIELGSASLVRISTINYAAFEGDSGTQAYPFDVMLESASSVPVSVDYATAVTGGPNAATPGVDYTAVSGRLTFAPGELRKTVFVTTFGDTAFEPDEEFTFNLSNCSGCELDFASGLGEIVNDDAAPPPGVSVNDVSVIEGNSGTTNATFTVSLSAAATANVTVRYATANGTATADSDYAARSGTVTFTPGQRSRTVAITVNGDTTVEPNETFFVNLSSASGATIADGQGVGTITNDDTAASAACISLPVSSFNFGSVKVGQTSTQRSLPITSCGTGPLNITRIGLTGDFIGTSNCPASLAPGASCALTGSFRPTATGVRNGSVTITSNAPTSPTVVQLTGTGTP